eukprot:1156946-Pelagomonas_calceolata.AAC.2
MGPVSLGAYQNIRVPLGASKNTECNAMHASITCLKGTSTLGAQHTGAHLTLVLPHLAIRRASWSLQCYLVPVPASKSKAQDS